MLARFFASLLVLSIAVTVAAQEREKDITDKINQKKQAAKAAAATRPAAKAPLKFAEQIFDYKAVAGRSLKAYVYRSPDDAVRPAIIVFHGGALMMGNAQLAPVQEGKPVQGKGRFIEQGCALVSIQYRLAPEVKLPEIIEDLKDAYAWVRRDGPKLFNIDPDRIGVMGSSAGGYLTLMSGFCVSPRPKALISVSGYGDIIGDWYAKPDDFYRKRALVTEKQAFRPGAGAELYLYCRQNGLWPKVLTGRDPATEPDRFKPYCPARNVTKDYPPTLLLHGDKDTDVPHSESVQMDKELTAHGVEHVFILNPGAGHGVGAFDPNRNRIEEQMVAFVQKYLNPVP